MLTKWPRATTCLKRGNISGTQRVKTLNNMAKLDAAERKALPKQDFALESKRAYPINDKSHARFALAMASKHASPSQKKEIRREVHEKYPSIGSKSKALKKRTK